MSVPASTYKERRASLRATLESLTRGKGGVSAGRVRGVPLPAKGRQFDAFLIDRLREPLGAKDEIFARGILPLLLDALKFERLDPMEMVGLRSHAFDGDALLVGLDDLGVVHSAATFQVVADGVAYVPSVVVRPDMQRKELSCGLLGVLLGTYRPRWAACRTQQAVLAQGWARRGTVYPIAAPPTDEARRVAEQVDAHLRRPGRPLEPREAPAPPAADLSRLVCPRLYDCKASQCALSEILRTIVTPTPDSAAARDFFARIKRREGDCMMLVLDADPEKIPAPEFLAPAGGSKSPSPSPPPSVVPVSPVSPAPATTAAAPAAAAPAAAAATAAAPAAPKRERDPNAPKLTAEEEAARDKRRQLKRQKKMEARISQLEAQQSAELEAAMAKARERAEKQAEDREKARWATMSDLSKGWGKDGGLAVRDAARAAEHRRGGGSQTPPPGDGAPAAAAAAPSSSPDPSSAAGTPPAKRKREKGAGRAASLFPPIPDLLGGEPAPPPVPVGRAAPAGRAIPSWAKAAPSWKDTQARLAGVAPRLHAGAEDAEA